MIVNMEYISWIGILGAFISMVALNLVIRYRKAVKQAVCQTNANSNSTNAYEATHRPVPEDQLLQTLRTIILAAAIFEQSERIQNWMNANPRLRFKLEQTQQAILDGAALDQVIHDFSEQLVQTLQQIRPPPFYEELLCLLGEYSKSCN